MFILWRQAYSNSTIHGKAAAALPSHQQSKFGPNLSDMQVNSLPKGHRHVVSVALKCTSFVYWHPQCMKNWGSVCVHSLRRSPLWGHLLSFQLNNLKKETDYWSLKVVPRCQGTEKTARRFWTILLAGRNMLQGRYVMKFKVQNIRSLLRDHTSTGQKAKTLSIRNLKRKCPALQKIVHD